MSDYVLIICLGIVVGVTLGLWALWHPDEEWTLGPRDDWDVTSWLASWAAPEQVKRRGNKHDDRWTNQAG